MVESSFPNQLIQMFLSVINLEEGLNVRNTPALKPLLHKDSSGLARKYNWNYR